MADKTVRTEVPRPEGAEAALAPFFAAARSERVDPPLALLSAILGDAAEATSARRRPPTQAPVRRRFAAPFGGLGGLAALGACAAVGLWLGTAGTVTIENGRVWAGSESAMPTTSDYATAAEQLDAFFELASTGG